MGKILQSHFDGHGLNESIVVEATDEVGPGGAHHRYVFTVPGRSETYSPLEVGVLQFQKGPRDEEGSIPGVLTGAVLAVLIDIAQDFQDGPFSSHENGEVLKHLQDALYWTKERAHNRAERGVLGQAKP